MNFRETRLSRRLENIPQIKKKNNYYKTPGEKGFKKIELIQFG